VTIGLVDTSVFCNVLNVPLRNDRHAEALSELQAYLDDGVTLLLPLAAVYETGNHIAHIARGSERRRVAERFAEQVRLAIMGDAPWTPTPLPDAAAIEAWLGEFPDQAMRGLGIGDLSIIQEFERQCALHRQRRVFVWSYDRHLAALDRAPGPEPGR